MPALAPALRAPHLLIPYAASLSPASRDALQALQLPNLARLLARLSLRAQDNDPEDMAHPLAMPHERALARALGLAQPPGQAPWAALAQQQAGGLHDAQDLQAAWAWITPCHWQVGMDSVTLDHPATLQLTETESRALLDAMAPYFSEDGIALAFDTADRWLARGEIFRNLATASLDRVIGHNVKGWLPEGRPGQLLRRLQSEMQMLLYTHPVNDARAIRRLAPVNAFWVSGAGALAWPEGAPAHPTAPGAHGDSPLVPQGLREAALREDWPAWRQAWQQIDATDCARLLAALEQTGHASLTLCSERSAHTFEAMPPSWVSRIGGLFKRPSPTAVLEAL